MMGISRAVAGDLNVPKKQLTSYLKHIERDYRDGGGDASTPFKADYEVGFKYIHVITTLGKQRASHSFIVNKATKKFNVGTILKSASWQHPATNFARGNLLTEDFARIKWTGAI